MKIGNLHLFFFFFSLLKHAPSNTLNYERQKAVQVQRSVLFTSEKDQRRGYSLKLSLGTVKMALYVNKVYVCLFVTKNMGMFIATGLTLKR